MTNPSENPSNYKNLIKSNRLLTLVIFFLQTNNNSGPNNYPMTPMMTNGNNAGNEAAGVTSATAGNGTLLPAKNLGKPSTSAPCLEPIEEIDEKNSKKHLLKSNGAATNIHSDQITHFD